MLKSMTAQTENNILQCYPEIAKLTVATPPWVDADNIVRYGKTVTINVDAILKCSPEDRAAARAIFETILKQIDEVEQ